jgi:phosphoglucosamine mutase
MYNRNFVPTPKHKMDKLFGTDGIRGVAGEFPLDARTIQIVGRSLATRMAAKLGRPARLVIGRDTRASGEWIEQAFCSGAWSAHAECNSAGVITTPGVAFVTRHFEFDAGIVISASHNPYEDNGIKIFAPSGKKIEEAAERLIEQDIRDAADPPIEKISSRADSFRVKEFRKAYLDYLSGEFPSLSLKGKKIVVDCANGASSDLAP